MVNNVLVDNNDATDFTVETEDQGSGVHRQVVKVAELPAGGLGGTQYTEGDTEAAIVGTAIMWEDSADTVRAVSAANPLPVDVGTVTVDGSGVTQPISAASLPLPSGASTAANQATANSSLSTIAGDTTSLDSKVTACDTGAVVISSGTVTANLGVTDNAVLDAIAASVAGTLTVNGSAVTQPVSAASLPLPTGAATESTLSTLNGKVTACNTGAVVVSSSALPSGAATAANQSTANTALSAIQTAVEGTLVTEESTGILPYAYDYYAVTYVASGNGAGEVETITYKTGGSGGTTVATLTFAYDGSGRVSSVTRS